MHQLQEFQDSDSLPLERLAADAGVAAAVVDELLQALAVWPESEVVFLEERLQCGWVS